MTKLNKELSEMNTHDYKVINLGLFNIRFHILADGSFTAAEFTSENQAPMFNCYAETIQELTTKLEIEMKECANNLIEHSISFDSEDPMPY